MKCFSESYLTEEVYLISFGGKGSNSTPSPKDKGHSLGGQLERAGLGEKVEFAAAGMDADGSGSGSPPCAARSGLPAESGQWGWAGPGLGGSPESGLSSPASPRFLASGSSGTSRRLSRPTMAAPPARPRSA